MSMSALLTYNLLYTKQCFSVLLTTAEVTTTGEKPQPVSHLPIEYPQF